MYSQIVNNVLTLNTNLLIKYEYDVDQNQWFKIQTRYIDPSLNIGIIETPMMGDKVGLASLMSRRALLMSKISNAKLKSIIDNGFRLASKIGSGGYCGRFKI